MPQSITLTDALVSATITWSRQGYIPAAVVIGGRVETETSLFTSSFPNNVALIEMWGGTSPSKNDKETKGSTADAYVKYAAKADDTNYDVIDSDFDGSSMEAHREVLSKTQDYGIGNAKSGYAMVDDTTWQFSGKVGLAARVQKNDISYVKFQGGDRGVEFDLRSKGKFFTGTIRGMFRIVAGSAIDGGFSDLVDNEFIPLSVTKSDRFMKKQVFNSYRDNPTSGTTPTTTVDGPTIIRDDTNDLENFAADTAAGNSVPILSGSIQLTGLNYWNVGDILNTIESVEGDIDINLAMVSIDFQYQPPGPAGTPSGDATIIELGRV